MIKHIITKECNRSCNYCISKNVFQKQNTNLQTVEALYAHLVEVSGINEIMLTGGEPTMAESFWQITLLAITYFKKVYITTQNPTMLNDVTAARAFEAITFSIHDKGEYKVNSKAVVYASILDSNYRSDLPYKLRKNGFAGLTVNENYFGHRQFTAKVPLLDDFSIRINKRGKCTNEPVILPDLSVAKDFNEYLSKPKSEKI